jgi:hypothetical protein
MATVSYYEGLYTVYSHRRYPYFDVVVGRVWSNDPESYAGGSIATGRVSLAGQVMTQPKRGPLVLQVGGWA